MERSIPQPQQLAKVCRGSAGPHWTKVQLCTSVNLRHHDGPAYRACMPIVCGWDADAAVYLFSGSDQAYTSLHMETWIC